MPAHERVEEAGRYRACYKIKLRSSGYRLVYQVIDQEIVVFVVAVDRRERDQAYKKAAERLE